MLSDDFHVGEHCKLSTAEGYTQWDLKKGAQRGKCKLRRYEEYQTQHGLDQVEEKSSRQFVVFSTTYALIVL